MNQLSDLQGKLACFSAELNRERTAGVEQFFRLCDILGRAHAECTAADSELAFKEWAEDEGYSRSQAYRMVGVASLAPKLKGRVPTLGHFDQSGLMLLGQHAEDHELVEMVLKLAKKGPVPHKEIKAAVDALSSGKAAQDPTSPKQGAGTDSPSTEAGGGGATTGEQPESPHFTQPTSGGERGDRTVDPTTISPQGSQDGDVAPAHDSSPEAVSQSAADKDRPPSSLTATGEGGAGLVCRLLEENDATTVFKWLWDAVTDVERVSIRCAVENLAGGDDPKRRRRKGGVGGGARATEVEIPEKLKTNGFPEAWNRYVAHRQEKKKALTSAAAEMQMGRCEEWGSSRAKAAIEATIEGNWLDLRYGDQRAQEGNGQADDPQGMVYRGD